MKFNGHIIAYGLLAILILFLLNSVLLKKGGDSPKKDSGSSWTVYGTHGCGWTRKQLEVMKSKQIPHKFIDCDKEDCKGADAFPTLVDPTGNKSVGFKDSF
jgi:hypothetical protein